MNRFLKWILVVVFLLAVVGCLVFVFGNLNDEESRVSKQMKEERNYHLLEQLHTLPSVGYLTRVRNSVPEPESQKHRGEEDNG